MHEWFALQSIENMNRTYTAIYRKTNKIVSKNIKRQAYV